MHRPEPKATGRRSQSRRGAPLLRLRVGFILIAMVLSFFGARLVQLQVIDPNAYAQLAMEKGTVDLVLSAERGDILDRNGQPLADSVKGVMVVADPEWTRPDAHQMATFLADRLGVDYFKTLKALKAKNSRFEYVARQVPATLGSEVLAEANDLGYEGLSTRPDPARDYPGNDVAANLVGFLGTPDPVKGAQPLAGLERTFNAQLAGKDGHTSYQVSGGRRIPLGANTTVEPQDGKDLKITIDQDLQWYTSRVLQQTVDSSGGESGFVIVLDRPTGQVLALADYPSYDATAPLEAKEQDRGSRSMQDVYEPGSVEKVLTFASLIDAGKVTPHTKITVPGQLNRQDAPIGDWWDHGAINLTATGVLAKSSNIGTVLATDTMPAAQLARYLRAFGLGNQTTDIGVRGEAPGILPEGAMLTSQTKDRIAFGQSISVNGMQMAAAINTIANGGVYVSPSLVEGHAVGDDGRQYGTDQATTRRVVSEKAAKQVSKMMEKVVDPEVQIAPDAAIPGYRVAGKTGTAQRVIEECNCYGDSFTVSFAGFAPADDPRFTVYVVVQDPRNGGGGGSVTGPAFAKIMKYALRRYGVAPTGTKPSNYPVTWGAGTSAR